MTKFIVTHIEVADSALKHCPVSGRELARREIRSLAEEIIFEPRQNKLFPIDSKYSCSNAIALTVLSSTASWCREWTCRLSGTTATINHYLEPSELKRHINKRNELKKNSQLFSFLYNPDVSKL